MAYSVSNDYKQVIYSGDSKNKLKLLFNNVELEDADLYCERLVIKSRIVPNGAKAFSLNNFISKEADLTLHNIDESIIQDQVSISIGTLVGNAYEYVPIGIFNIQDQPTNDKNKTTIKLRDNSVKFDFNYNAQDLIEANNGRATKLQILQDICSQANVTCNITSFIGYIDEIGVYDNTISARQYIANIAEQAGKIATINRSGELIFLDLNDLATWEIPIDIVEKYESGTTYKIGKVVYEDGIVRYETDDSNDDTLFLNGSNNYINGELVREQASSNMGLYNLQNTGEAQLAKFQLEGKTTQATRSGKNLLPNNAISQTINNVTFTVNTDKSITINGTANGRADLYLFGSSTDTGNYLYIPRGTYVINTQNLVDGRLFLAFREKTAGTKYATTLNDGAITLMANQDCYFYGVMLGFESGQAATNLTIYPQLEAGSQITPYEPYGVQPSPDFPSKLVSVGYENLVKNYYVENYTAQYASVLWVDFDIQPNTTYTISFEGTEGNHLYLNENLFTQVTFYVKSGKTVITSTTKSSLPSNQWDSTRNGWIIFKNYTGGVLSANVFDDLQIEKGTEAHSLISYGKYGIEIKNIGKNLFSSGLEIGSIDNTTGQNVSNNNCIRSIDYIKVEPNTTYTLSNILDYNCLVHEYTEDGTYIQYDENYNSPRTFTTTPNTHYIRVRSAAGSVQNDLNGKYQLERGTQATTYEEYISNTQLYVLDNPLRSIGNVKDELYIENGTLKVERKIGKTILNGTENWGYWNNAFYCDVSFDYLKATGITTICNYFKGSNNNTGGASAYNNGNYTISLYKNSDYNRIYIRNDDKSTADDFKTWLLTHNTEVDYVLATPNIEELGNIELPTTYEGITNITLNNGIDTYSYLQYRKNKTQLEAILDEVNEFDIDSLKTGKIIGNPAIDPYDLIQIVDGENTYTTLATNDLTYTGVLINTFDTQIGEEAKEQNVFVNGEETFKKWARTTIDNIEGSITLQAGQIDEANGRIYETNLVIEKDGALLSVLANNSNIDISYDENNNPISGEVREVTTTTGFRFDAEGMTIEDSNSNFKALHRNTGTYYQDGTTIVGQYTKDGSKQKDLDLFGVYTYGKNDIEETPMFIAQLFTDGNGEEAFGHFYNRGD